MGLAEAGEARDAECPEIHAELALAHDEGARIGGRARRHLRDCESCTVYRAELRGVSRSFGAFVPALAPAAALAKLLGLGGGGAAASGSAAIGGSGAASGALAVVTTKVVAVVCVAVVTAGGAVEVSRHFDRGGASGAHSHRTAHKHAVDPAVDRTSSAVAAAEHHATVPPARAYAPTRYVPRAHHRFFSPHHGAASAVAAPPADPASSVAPATAQPSTDPAGTPGTSDPSTPAADAAPPASPDPVATPASDPAAPPTASAAATNGGIAP